MGRLVVPAARSSYTCWSRRWPPMVGGALWAGIAGLLKARTGAHEVIVTIMLNYVRVLSDRLPASDAGGAAGGGHTNNPMSHRPPTRNAIMPTLSDLLGVGAFRLNFGFILVILATVLFLVPDEPVEPRIPLPRRGARTARRTRCRHQCEDSSTSSRCCSPAALARSGRFDPDPGDHQHYELLVRRRRRHRIRRHHGRAPRAIQAAPASSSAGVLFGALKAGGYTMQASQGIPIDIILVVQSIIVLLIAAPPAGARELPPPAAG